VSAPPIPLASPDGTVYAYACPRCRKVKAGSEYGGAHDDARVASIAESSLRDADRCCRCRVCGSDVAPSMSWPRECDACKPAEDAKRSAAAADQASKDARDAAVQEAALALALDRDAAVRLRDVMSGLSEEHYCAGWLHGLEFMLWDACQTDEPCMFGWSVVDVAEVAELRRLSKKSGGWWRFDDEHGETFVTMDEWQVRYEAHRA